MRLGIDASNVRGGGGVTYLSELLKAVKPEEHGINQVIVWTGQDTLNHLPIKPWLELVYVPMLDQGILARVYWQKFELPRLVQKNCDILFLPGGTYTGNFRPFVTISRNILPFDVTEMKRYGFSLGLLRLLLLRIIQSKTFQEADGLIFLTSYAKKTIQKVSGKFKGISTIIPHGVNEQFRLKPRLQKEISTYSLVNPYRILYVSTINVYKHQWHVVEAVAQLRTEGLPIELTLIGTAYYIPSLNRLQTVVNNLDPRQEFIRYLGAISYSNLPLNYHQSDAFVFASSCENMPHILIEAMASGLPIACSNCGPMPEILDDAGLYFDPEQPLEIANILRNLIINPSLRETLANKAFSRALNYSWGRCAKETFSFIGKFTKEPLLKK